jgi:SPX domain protein involved in polyphosphate accumulation
MATFLAPAPSLQALAGGVTAQRFEMKYILNEYQAERVRQYISAWMLPDPKAKFGHRYPLSSVYLDSPNLALYWSSALGEAKRFKLRVRTYSEDPNEPAFFEIKSRYNGIVLKKRALVKKQWVGPFFRGESLPREAMVLDDAAGYENLELFRSHVNALGASPRVHVRYMREAYMSRADDPVRITFDSDIACLPSLGPIEKIRLNGRGWRHLQSPPVILEIKFTDSYPAWVQEMIQRFSLMRDSFAKYVYCVKLLKDEGYDIKYGLPMGGCPA